MRKTSDATTWKILTFVGASGAVLATNWLLKNLWHASTGKKPPTNPAAKETAWSEALMWTAASSLAAGLAKLVAKRQAAQFKRGSIPALGVNG